MPDGVGPGAPDVVDRAAHAEGIDAGRRRQRAGRHRHVEAAAVGAHHIGEKEGAPLVLVEATLELPAHQRVQFGVLVDLAVDAHQQAGGLQIGEMLLEIGRRAAGFGVIFALGRSLAHGATLWFWKPSAYTGWVHDGQ
jgi:hypothetical protein